jgi:hypothetical protein
MLSHPMTFLAGYLIMTFIIAFVIVGPGAVFVSMLFRRKLEKRFTDGIYLGAAVTAYGFMVLHYGLYLRGYRITHWPDLLKDVFYPPAYF